MKGQRVNPEKLNPMEMNSMSSMMGMMSLGLDLDRLEDLTVVADGVDEEEAVSKIEYYLTKGA